MRKIIGILCFLVALVMSFISFPLGAVAVLVVVAFTAIAIFLIRQNEFDKDFLVQIFLAALLVRIIFGVFVYTSDLKEFFGGDAITYDGFAKQMVDYWSGRISFNEAQFLKRFNTGMPGWGMFYLVAFIYSIIGPNILAAQSFFAVIGAATAPMVYICAYQIFNNRRVSRVAALLVAFFPAFIIWSSQLLKDGLIIFLLVLAMTMVIQLQKRFNYLAVALLIFALFGILSLRFYIFYMAAIAVAGSFIVGQSSSGKSIIRNIILLIIVGLGLTYLGVLRTATENLNKYGSLEKVQQSRLDLATSAESGFGGDVDVSTTEGAITAIPLGLTYLMLAPFPWQITNFRQAITLPEILIWWAMIPLIFSGLWYTIKNRLRSAIPILIFTFMLTIAYSIFQGNVGTAYRQRTQIQVFLFIFIAVGWSLRQEVKENRQIRNLERQRQKEQFLRDKRTENLMLGDKK